ATTLPLLCDADTGFGESLNVERTVQLFEQAGAAGIHLEDQQMPKRCGHLSGKSLVPAEDMAAKVRAAVAARRDPDFVIIARTDFRVAMKAAEETLAGVLRDGHQRAAIPRMMSRAELYDVLGYTGYEQRDRAYFSHTKQAGESHDPSPRS